MKLTRLLAGLYLLSAVTLRAGAGFPAVPPETWNLRSGEKGAVILEDRIRLGVTSISYVYRVRIFSEAGRGAAEVPDIPSKAYDLTGRTVYPDGREVVFNSRKDFAEVKAKSGSWNGSLTRLMAPGVTTDCVVEIRWSEPADGPNLGLPSRLGWGYSYEWTLANAYPTQMVVVEMGRPFPLTWSLMPGGGAKPEVTETNAYQTFTFRNVPAMDLPPYALKPTLQLPKLAVFYMPPSLRGPARRGESFFWDAACLDLVREDYEESIGKGSAYRALVKELTANLPTGAVPMAMELLMRLDGRIINLSRATHVEAATIPKDFWEKWDPKDLDKMAKLGKTNAQGMRLLYYHLLKEVGISPLIAELVDRDRAFFDWRQTNPYQFHHTVLGVEGADKEAVWLDPTARYAAPGVIHPDFTGVGALVIDTRTWKGSRRPVGSLPASANTVKLDYRLQLEEEGDGFTVAAGFTGFPEYSERYEFLTLEPKEQAKVLKERLERNLKNLKVSSTEVFNATDPKAYVHWKASGILERESGRHREVEPFPGMRWPLWVPSKLSEDRSLPIVLPFLMSQKAVSTFKVPKGFVIPPQIPVKGENAFGRVSWSASMDEASGEVQVLLEVEVSTLSAAPASWPDFRTFLGWVETACRRTVVLSRQS